MRLELNTRRRNTEGWKKYQETEQTGPKPRNPTVTQVLIVTFLIDAARHQSGSQDITYFSSYAAHKMDGHIWLQPSRILMWQPSIWSGPLLHLDVATRQKKMEIGNAWMDGWTERRYSQLPLFVPQQGTINHKRLKIKLTKHRWWPPSPNIPLGQFFVHI